MLQEIEESARAAELEHNKAEKLAKKREEQLKDRIAVSTDHSAVCVRVCVYVCVMARSRPVCVCLCVLSADT